MYGSGNDRGNEPMKASEKDEYRRLLKQLENLKPNGPPESDELKSLVKLLPALRANPIAGEVPQFGRQPGKGRRGELYVRNRLWLLRCMPTDNQGYLFFLSPEYPVYELPKSRLSIDLLAIFKNHRKRVAYTAIIELKWMSNNPLYALFEVARNAVLLDQSKTRVEKSWGNRVETAYPAGMFRRRIFSEITREHIIGMVVGPPEWYEKYSGQKRVCINTARRVGRASKGIRFEFWTFPKGTRCKSAPHQFLPLTRVW